MSIGLPMWRSGSATGWASPVRTPTPVASTPPVDVAVPGPCASTRASLRPPSRTADSATSSGGARPGCRWRSTAIQIRNDSDDPRVSGEVGGGGVPIDSVHDMERLLDGIDLGRREHLDDDQRHRRHPARALRGGRPPAGDRARPPTWHRPERHPQGIRRARDLYLPAPAVPSAGDRPHRLLPIRPAPVQPDQHQRLPHAGGRRDRGPGAGLHHGQRDQLRGRGHRRWSRLRRLRAPAVVLLCCAQRPVRGGGEVPRFPASVGAASRATGTERPIRGA